MGSVTSDPPLVLNKGDELQLSASASGILGVPSFKLLWQPTEAGVPEEVCLAILTEVILCRMTDSYC